jgi:hypothetical protein
MRYLSDLRIHPDWRRGSVLARGFRILREKVFAQGEWAQTLVLAQNSPALGFLRSRRAGLPEYLEAGLYKNWILPCQRVSQPTHRVRKARPGDLPEIQSLLDVFSKRRSFSPVIDLTKIGAAYLNGLEMDDFLVAEGNGEIIGTMALWDQGGFQRLRVDGYSTGFSMARPFLNLHARLRGGAVFPAPGNAIPMLKASAIACADDDPAILRSLLAAAFPLLGGKLLSIGLSEADPLAAALEDLRGKIFTGRHFLVGWEGSPPAWEEPFGFDVGRI